MKLQKSNKLSSNYNSTNKLEEHKSSLFLSNTEPTFLKKIKKAMKEKRKENKEDFDTKISRGDLFINSQLKKSKELLNQFLESSNAVNSKNNQIKFNIEEKQKAENLFPFASDGGGIAHQGQNENSLRNKGQFNFGYLERMKEKMIKALRFNQKITISKNSVVFITKIQEKFKKIKTYISLKWIVFIIFCFFLLLSDLIPISFLVVCVLLIFLSFEDYNKIKIKIMEFLFDDYFSRIYWKNEINSKLNLLPIILLPILFFFGFNSTERFELCLQKASEIHKEILFNEDFTYSTNFEYENETENETELFAYNDLKGNYNSTRIMKNGEIGNKATKSNQVKKTRKRDNEQTSKKEKAKGKSIKENKKKKLNKEEVKRNANTYNNINSYSNTTNTNKSNLNESIFHNKNTEKHLIDNFIVNRFLDNLNKNFIDFLPITNKTNESKLKEILKDYELNLIYYDCIRENKHHHTKNYMTMFFFTMIFSFIIQIVNFVLNYNFIKFILFQTSSSSTGETNKIKIKEESNLGSFRIIKEKEDSIRNSKENPSCITDECRNSTFHHSKEIKSKFSNSSSKNLIELNKNMTQLPYLNSTNNTTTNTNAVNPNTKIEKEKLEGDQHKKFKFNFLNSDKRRSKSSNNSNYSTGNGVVGSGSTNQIFNTNYNTTSNLMNNKEASTLNTEEVILNFVYFNQNKIKLINELKQNEEYYSSFINDLILEIEEQEEIEKSLHAQEANENSNLFSNSAKNKESFKLKKSFSTAFKPNEESTTEREKVKSNLGMKLNLEETVKEDYKEDDKEDKEEEEVVITEEEIRKKAYDKMKTLRSMKNSNMKIEDIIIEEEKEHEQRRNSTLSLKGNSLKNSNSSKKADEKKKDEDEKEVNIEAEFTQSKISKLSKKSFNSSFYKNKIESNPMKLLLKGHNNQKKGQGGKENDGWVIRTLNDNRERQVNVEVEDNVKAKLHYDVIQAVKSNNSNSRYNFNHIYNLDLLKNTNEKEKEKDELASKKSNVSKISKASKSIVESLKESLISNNESKNNNISKTANSRKTVEFYNNQIKNTNETSNTKNEKSDFEKLKEKNQDKLNLKFLNLKKNQINGNNNTMSYNNDNDNSNYNNQLLPNETPNFSLYNLNNNSLQFQSLNKNFSFGVFKKEEKEKPNTNFSKKNNDNLNKVEEEDYRFTLGEIKLKNLKENFNSNSKISKIFLPENNFKSISVQNSPKNLNSPTSVNFSSNATSKNENEEGNFSNLNNFSKLHSSKKKKQKRSSTQNKPRRFSKINGILLKNNSDEKFKRKKVRKVGKEGRLINLDNLENYYENFDHFQTKTNKSNMYFKKQGNQTNPISVRNFSLKPNYSSFGKALEYNTKELESFIGNGDSKKNYIKLTTVINDSSKIKSNKDISKFCLIKDELKQSLTLTEMANVSKILETKTSNKTKKKKRQNQQIELILKNKKRKLDFQILNSFIQDKILISFIVVSFFNIFFLCLGAFPFSFSLQSIKFNSNLKHFKRNIEMFVSDAQLKHSVEFNTTFFLIFCLLITFLCDYFYSLLFIHSSETGKTKNSSSSLQSALSHFLTQC